MGRNAKGVMAFARRITGGVWRCCYIACGFVLLFPVIAVTAQEPSRGATVTDRRPSEMVPLGVTAGGFVLLPSLTVLGIYDDNIQAAEDNKKTSFLYELSPEFSIHSNWYTHALDLLVRANIGRYSDFSNEDYNDWEVFADVRLDARHNVQIYGGVSVGRDHVSRSSPLDSDGLEPTKFDRANAHGRYSHQLGHFSLQLSAAVTRKNFGDVVNIRNGNLVQVNQDDLDRTKYTVEGRLGYEILPGYDSFILLIQDRRDYDDLDDFTNANRSSEGETAVVGITLGLGSATFGDIFAGYRIQDYETPFPDINTPVFGMSIYWSPSNLTTFSFAVERTINDAINSNFSGYTSTETSIAVDHELRRNILLNMDLHYSNDKYEGIRSAVRDDITYDFGLGPTYLINRNLHLSAQFHYLRRETDDNTVTTEMTSEFEKNIFLIQLRMQL